MNNENTGRALQHSSGGQKKQKPGAYRETAGGRNDRRRQKNEALNEENQPLAVAPAVQNGKVQSRNHNSGGTTVERPVNLQAPQPPREDDISRRNIPSGRHKQQPEPQRNKNIESTTQPSPSTTEDNRLGPSTNNTGLSHQTASTGSDAVDGTILSPTTGGGFRSTTSQQSGELEGSVVSGDGGVAIARPATQAEDYVAGLIQRMQGQLEGVLERRVEQELKERRNKEIVVAEPVQTEVGPVIEPSKICGLPKPIFYFSVLAIVVTLIAVGVTVGLVLSKKEPSDETLPTEPPTAQSTFVTMEPTSIRYATLMKVLDPVLSTEDLHESSSPQSKALQFILDPTTSIINMETAEPQIVIERFVITLLYYSMQGDMWTDNLNFLTPSSVCQWNGGRNAPGVICDRGSIVTIDMIDIGIIGQLPTAIRFLTDLKHLFLEGNIITGTLPTEFGQLSKLENLYANDNILTGTIPTEYGMLTNLIELNMRENRFHGTIPTEFAKLSTLEDIALSFNDLNGTLPTYFPQERMIYIDLGENNFYGTLPTQFGSLTGLHNLYVENNDLSGTLPSEIGNLSLLIHLWLDDNDFTGTIPTEYSNLSSLTSARFNQNLFDGDLEIALCERFNPIQELLADCLGDIPAVTCSCCTICCEFSFCETVET